VLAYLKKQTNARLQTSMKQTKSKNADAAILHGECGIIQTKIPKGATPVKVENGVLILADSETTGNHHVLDMVPGVEVLEKDKKRFIRNSAPAQVRCIHADRHDTLTIPPGEWELSIAQEFDYFEMAKRNVRD
jgi:hypothetical protein